MGDESYVAELEKAVDKRIRELHQHPARIAELEAALAVMRAALDTLQGECATMREALRNARHELTTLHGLTASDGLGEYSSALSEGLDHQAAWHCFCEETWTIDTLKTVAAIDAALASGAGRAAAEVLEAAIGWRTWMNRSTGSPPLQGWADEPRALWDAVTALLEVQRG